MEIDIYKQGSLLQVMITTLLALPGTTGARQSLARQPKQSTFRHLSSTSTQC